MSNKDLAHWLDAEIYRIYPELKFSAIVYNDISTTMLHYYQCSWCWAFLHYKDSKNIIVIYTYNENEKPNRAFAN